MLVHLYTIIALFVFLVAMVLGSSPEAGIIKSASVFIGLVVITRTGTLLVNIIKGQTPKPVQETNQTPPTTDSSLKKAA